MLYGCLRGLSQYLKMFLLKFFEDVLRYSHSLSSADSRRPVVSFWQKNVHNIILVILRGLSLPIKSVVR